MTPDDKRRLIERIANSASFRKAPKVRDLLLYTAECTIEERLDDVREQVIASRVFNRNNDVYDAQDSIVRAEARNLRKRLDQFFSTEGKDEPVVVTMPKGRYSLAFEPRVPEVLPPTPQAPTDVVVVPGSSIPVNRRYHPDGRILAGLLALIAIIVISQSNAVRGWGRGRAERLLLPFSALFDGKKDVIIVTSDVSLLHMAGAAGRMITLDEYIVRNYPEVIKRGSDMRNYTDADEVATAALIVQANPQIVRRVTIRSGHQVELADFKTHNVILMGSPITNPWTQLYDSQTTFKMALETNSLHIVFKDTSGKTDPQTLQLLEHNQSYAQIAFVPNVNSDGWALLMGGTSAPATAAAGEFLLDQDRFSSFLRGIGIDPAGPPRQFEVLLRVTEVANGSAQSTVIAHRLGNRTSSPK